MLNYGADRFRAQENSLIDGGHYAQTSAGSKLLKGYLSQVSEYISNYLAGNCGRRGKYWKVLDLVDADKIAMFTLQSCITALYVESHVTSIVRQIGGMVQDELRFKTFEAENSELFRTLQNDMDRRQTDSYRHRHRVLVHAMNKEQIEWKAWDDETRFGVGATALSLMLKSSDLFEKKTISSARKKQQFLVPSEAALEWMERSDEAVAAMLPDRMPCLIPPADWDDNYAGGYYTPKLRMMTPLVKTRRGPAGDAHRRLLRSTEMPEVLNAVNALQRTPWRVNSAVLETMQIVWDQNLGIGMPPSEPLDIPQSPVHNLDRSNLTPQQEKDFQDWKGIAREMHTMEKQRQGKVLQTARTIRIAGLLKDKEQFYYVYQCDFRGRVYSAASGVSPQGDDAGKAVLQFGEAKPLGTRGLYWLKVHGANKYGEDKCSFDARAAWIEDRHDQWVAVAEDPIGARAYWKDADKPWQFLAFCFEYAEAVQVGAAYRSRLPIALDGSCNGLQHFSAMLRDRVGGRAVNLTDTGQPEDVYQEVADVCWDKLLLARSSGEGMAANWIDCIQAAGHETMPRSLTKKPVMTLPYGSTQQACTGSILAWYAPIGSGLPDNETFAHCVYLSHLLWESISEVVVAARGAMDWLQEAAGTLAHEGEPLVYRSPMNFPVYQGSRKSEKKEVYCSIGGSRMHLMIQVDTEEIDARRQRQGSSPNLVHHVDATHMMMCINAGAEQGIDSFAMIHDDFGTHACHIDEWHGIIRHCFVRMHSDNDFLGKFKKTQENSSGLTLNTLPPSGDLDIEEVFESTYFFG